MSKKKKNKTVDKTALYNDFMLGMNYSQLGRKYGISDKTARTYILQIDEKTSKMEDKPLIRNTSRKSDIVDIKNNAEEKFWTITQTIGKMLEDDLEKVVSGEIELTVMEKAHLYSKLHDIAIKREENYIKWDKNKIEREKLEMLKNGDIKPIDNSVSEFVTRLGSKLIPIKVGNNE